MAAPDSDFVMVSFTQEWHSQPYPFISPARPELSAKGKNIVITGGGTGIGRAIGIAFAQAGAKSICVMGRRADKLAMSVSVISNAAAASFHGDTTKVFYEVVDLVDMEQTVKVFDSIASKVGKIHILVSNAGASSELLPVAKYHTETLTRAFESNVVSALHTFQAFLPHASPEDPVVLNTTSSLANISPLADSGAYSATKACAMKLWDQIAKENKHLRVVSVHPGWTPTELNGNQEEAPDAGEFSLTRGLDCSCHVADPHVTYTQLSYRENSLSGLRRPRPPFSMGRSFGRIGTLKSSVAGPRRLRARGY